METPDAVQTMPESEQQSEASYQLELLKQYLQQRQQQIVFVHFPIDASQQRPQTAGQLHMAPVVPQMQPMHVVHPPGIDHGLSQQQTSMHPQNAPIVEQPPYSFSFLPPTVSPVVPAHAGPSQVQLVAHPIDPSRQQTSMQPQIAPIVEQPHASPVVPANVGTSQVQPVAQRARQVPKKQARTQTQQAQLQVLLAEKQARTQTHQAQSRQVPKKQARPQTQQAQPRRVPKKQARPQAQQAQPRRVTKNQARPQTQQAQPRRVPKTIPAQPPGDPPITCCYPWSCSEDCSAEDCGTITEILLYITCGICILGLHFCAKAH